MFMTKKLARLVITMLAAATFPMLVAAESKPAPKPAAKPTAKPAPKRTAKPQAKPAPPVVVPKSPVTISITSRIRQGTLVVSLDGVPVFTEEFRKPMFLISQTTTWGDPLQVAAGKHKLTAQVHGRKGKKYLSEVYDLEVSRTKGIELRLRMKGDTLTVEPVS